MTEVYYELVSVVDRNDQFQQLRLTEIGRMLEQCHQKGAKMKSLWVKGILIEGQCRAWYIFSHRQSEVARRYSDD